MIFLHELLKSNLRPISDSKLISPVDGVVSQSGKIQRLSNAYKPKGVNIQLQSFSQTKLQKNWKMEALQQYTYHLKTTIVFICLVMEP